VKRKRLLYWSFLGVAILVMSLSIRHFVTKRSKMGQASETVNAISKNANTNHFEDMGNTDSKPPEEFLPYEYSREVRSAQKDGAKAKITLKIVDSTGRRVPGARVHLRFVFFERENNVVKGVSDENGFFTAEKESTWRCEWAVQKDGYYDTTGLHSWTQGLSNESVKNGRWQPWNPTVEVVLKEKRNPIQMLTRTVEVPMPAYDTSIGFDLEQGEWVTPYGKGIHTDVAFEMADDYIDRNNQGQMFKLLFTNSVDGVVKKAKDTFSGFLSDYEAPLDGYQSELLSQWRVENGRMMEDSRIGEDDYLIFRYRSRVDEKGNVTEARYGKLYGKLEYSFGVQHKRRIHFTYYLNPTPNDRNLEAEGQRP
jgi:hypothetical protein